jgi:hypothetical protein
VILLLGSFSRVEARAGYSARGMLTYDVPNHPPVLRRHYCISVSECLWQIQVTLDDSKDFISFNYQFDGTNNLGYALMTKSGPDIGSGLVEPGPVPRTWTSAGGEYVWLAYASGCYFRLRNTGSAMSLSDLRSPNNKTLRYEVPADWVCSSNAPFLPISILYHHTADLTLDDDGSVQSTQLPPEFASGFVHARYTATALTNVDGLALPIEFDYTIYERDRIKQSKSLRAAAIVHGTTTNIGPFIPFSQTPGILHLTDHRTPDPYVVYKVTNGQLPDLQSALLADARAHGTAVFNNVIHQPVLRKTRPTYYQRGIVIAVLAFITLAPLVPIALRWKKTIRDKTNQLI